MNAPLNQTTSDFQAACEAADIAALFKHMDNRRLAALIASLRRRDHGTAGVPALVLALAEDEAISRFLSSQPGAAP